jgi:predicted negative regulator of RcsB-dependent stress response
MLNTTGKKIIAAIAAVFVAFVGWNFFSGEETETAEAVSAETTTTEENTTTTNESDAEAVRAADAAILNGEQTGTSDETTTQTEESGE